MSDDVLNEQETEALRLPKHVPFSKDLIEWGRESRCAVNLECSVCHNTVTRVLTVPSDVSLKTPTFTCASCNGRIGFSRKSKRPHRNRAANQNVTEPRPQTGQPARQTETLFESPLSAGLAGTLSDSLEFLAPSAR